MKFRPALLGAAFLVFLALASFIIPLFSSYSYSQQDLSSANLAPSLKHLMGTDKLGRDLFIRVLYGARISLSVGVLAALIQGTIGVIYGGIAAMAGGKIDNLMMRIVDLLYGIPFTLVVILLLVLFEPGFGNIVLALGLVFWLPMARIVRGQVLLLKEKDFITAAKALGASKTRILCLHLLPNVSGPILVTMLLAVPEAIFAEAFLSFIGLGVEAPMASWGVLAREGLAGLRSYPWQLLFPSLAIIFTMLSLNFLGEGQK